MGRVEAVYHQGVVTFTVEHRDAVSASVQVYDLASDSLAYDSGPRARTRVTWPAGYDIDDEFRFVVTAWNSDGEVVVSQVATTTGHASISEISFDSIPSETSVVGPDEIDLLGDVNIGTIPGVRVYQDYDGKGGGIELYDEAGFFRTVTILPTGSSVGGQVRALGPSGAAWISGEHPLHGNESALGVFGTSDFYVWAGETGNESVEMPDDAVSAAETWDEPGVAAAHESSLLQVPQPATNAIYTSIVAPTDGFLLATGFVSGEIYHTQYVASSYHCSISQSDTIPYIDGLSQVFLEPDLPTGPYQLPVSVSRVLPVSAGTETIYIVCAKGIGSAVSIHDRHLNLLFVPTWYGSGSPPRGDEQ
jgi:hypothetical protein